jgi:hypothetical protein
MPEGTWEDGFEGGGLAAWLIVENFDDLHLEARVRSIDPGAVTRVVVTSPNLAYLGRICRLSLTNPAVGVATWYEDLMEPNALGGVEAVFLVTGLVPGETRIFAEVDSGT